MGIREQIEDARACADGPDDILIELADTMEVMFSVIEAASIYRKHMTGEIEPVQACGMDLDEALAKLEERYDHPKPD